jgi:O-antigen/teichoic acid export membrane protein
VLAFAAGMGLSDAVLRFVPEYIVKQDWAHLRGIIWASWGQTLAIGLVISSLGTGLLLWIATWHHLENATAIVLGIWTVPVIALAKLQTEISRGVRQIALAYLPSLILHPLLLIGGAFLWFQVQKDLTSVDAIALSLLFLPILLILQLQLIHIELAPKIDRIRPAYSLRQWLFVSLPLLFINGSFVILNQTDTLTIGAMMGTREVGIYNAAVRTASWVNFSLMSVNAIAAPLFAALYAKGDIEGLQKLVSIIARWMFLPALLVAIALTLFAEPILGLFGAEFIAAKWVIATLAVGQLVNVGAGSVGYLLIMTGHHNQCAYVVGISALVNLVLNLIWIPQIGILGAAIATSLSMALWNIWMNRLVVKYLGVDPSIVAALRA